MADEYYVSTLDEKTLQKAKDEICEDPKERMNAVQTFRQWILSQNYLTGPTGKIMHV